MYKEIAVQVTDNCNLNCPYCFADKNSNSVLSDSELDFFIKFCNENEIESLKITGGEPFLYRNLNKLVSKINNDTNILIFSNFTIEKCVEYLPHRKVTILVNVNDRTVIDDVQWKNLNENIEIALNLGHRIILGKTLYQKPYNLEDIICLCKKFNIDKLRLSQASPKENMENEWSNISEIRELYRHIYKIYKYDLKPMGISIQFDCPISPCLIDKEVFEYFLKEDCLKTICKSRVFVTSDMKVNHCYVTKNYVGGKCLHNFEDFYSVFSYIDESIDDYRKMIDKSSCLNCAYNNDIKPCGCFSFMRGEKNEDK